VSSPRRPRPTPPCSRGPCWLCARCRCVGCPAPYPPGPIPTRPQTHPAPYPPGPIPTRPAPASIQQGSSRHLASRSAAPSARRPPPPAPQVSVAPAEAAPADLEAEAMRASAALAHLRAAEAEAEAEGEGARGRLGVWGGGGCGGNARRSACLALAPGTHPPEPKLPTPCPRAPPGLRLNRTPRPRGGCAARWRHRGGHARNGPRHPAAVPRAWMWGPPPASPGAACTASRHRSSAATRRAQSPCQGPTPQSAPGISPGLPAGAAANASCLSKARSTDRSPARAPPPLHAPSPPRLPSIRTARCGPWSSSAASTRRRA
jgi:hypothetical protein